MLDVTCLSGLMMNRNNLVSDSYNPLVLFLYALRVSTLHTCIFVLQGNEGKKNSFTGFPYLDWLARPLGKKVTPSDWY